MTIKYSKETAYFPNTQNGSSSQTAVDAYNEYLYPTSFTMSCASPFSFKNASDSAWQTSNSETLTNILATVTDPIETYITSTILQSGDNFYVYGTYISSTPTYNIFLKEFDRSGTELQSQTWNVGNTTNPAAYVADGMIIKDGYVYLAGNTTTYAKVYKVDIEDFTTSSFITWTIHDKTQIADMTATDTHIYICGKEEDSSVWSGAAGMIPFSDFSNITIDDSATSAADVYCIAAIPEIATDTDLIVVGIKSAAGIIQYGGIHAVKSTNSMSSDSAIGFTVHPDTATSYDATTTPKRIIYDSSNNVLHAMTTDTDGVSSDIYELIPSVGTIASGATDTITYDDTTLVLDDFEISFIFNPQTSAVSTSTILWNTKDGSNTLGKFWINASDNLEFGLYDGTALRVAWTSTSTYSFAQYASQRFTISRTATTWTVTLNGDAVAGTQGSSDYDKIPLELGTTGQFLLGTSNVAMYGASLYTGDTLIYDMKMDNYDSPNYVFGDATATGFSATTGISYESKATAFANEAFVDMKLYDSYLYIGGIDATETSLTLYRVEPSSTSEAYLTDWSLVNIYNGSTADSYVASALCIDDGVSITTNNDTFTDAVYFSFYLPTSINEFKLARISTEGSFDINADEYDLKFSPTSEGLFVDDLENGIALNVVHLRGICIAVITLTNYPYGILEMEVGYRDAYKYQGTPTTQAVVTYSRDTGGVTTPRYYYHPDGYMVQDDTNGDYIANSSVDVSLQTTVSANDYESYIDTINIYYDPTGLSRGEIEDSTIDIWVQTAISLMRSELYTTADSNYDFNTEYEYFEMGEEVETARIPATYSASMADTYCAGRKQIEVYETTLDAKDAKCIKLRLKARLTDADGSNTKYDDWAVYNVNILPRGNLYLEGNDA